MLVVDTVVEVVEELVEEDVVEEEEDVVEDELVEDEVVEEEVISHDGSSIHRFSENEQVPQFLV